MSPLTGLSVSLAALKLGGVSTVGWGLVMLPVVLQGALTCIQGVLAYRKMQKVIEQIENEQKEK
jgi:hypothetical protein